MLESIVVRRMDHAAQARHVGNRGKALQPQNQYFKSMLASLEVSSVMDARFMLFYMATLALS